MAFFVPYREGKDGCKQANFSGKRPTIRADLIPQCSNLGISTIYPEINGFIMTIKIWNANNPIAVILIGQNYIQIYESTLVFDL